MVLDLGQNCCDKEGMDKSLAVISSIPFFSGLSREQLADVGRIAVEKRFRKGEIIFSEGDEGDGFYLVIDGRIKVFKLSADGKEHILHVFAAGQTARSRYLRASSFRRTPRRSPTRARCSFPGPLSWPSSAITPSWP
jgi:hypothetical protein